MAYTFQQAASNSTTGATSLAVTFANAPASGELIVATVATNSSTATITAPSGFSTKVSNANTSRSIGIYWKIAGSSESTSYTWNFSASIAAAIVMRRFSSNYGWNTDQSGGASNYAWDNTSVSSVSMSITTTANRLVVGDGYSSNTTSTNKQLNPNSNWLDNTLLYSNRTRSAYRTAAGGAETLGYQLTDSAVDTRLAIMAAEFVEYTTKTANASTKALSTSWNGRKYSDPSKVPSADTTPDAFSFTDQTGVALSSTITSAAITVSGINSAATITSSGGTFDINNSGTFISSGTVNNGDTVRARVTSSSSNSTAVNCVVTIGGVSDTFTATTLSGSFSLTALYTFGGGTNGAAVGILSKPNSGEVQTSYAGGYGSTYSTAQTRGGRTTSIRTTIKAASDGDPSDVGAGMGLFGSNITLPTTARCGDGDTLHTIMALYFDPTFDTHTNTGVLKFIRFLQGDGTYGHLDHLILNDYGYIEGDTATAGPHSPHGFAFGNESDHSGEVWKSGYGYVSGIRSNRNVTRGAWCILELRQKFSTNAATASRTIWIDGQFVVDFTGNTKTYINESGSLVTLTGGQCVNIGSGKTIDTMRLFTYWNGYAPKDQGVYIDSIGFYKIPSGQSDNLPNTDSYGNKFIGLGVI